MHKTTVAPKPKPCSNRTYNSYEASSDLPRYPAPTLVVSNDLAFFLAFLCFTSEYVYCFGETIAVSAHQAKTVTLVFIGIGNIELH